MTDHPTQTDDHPRPRSRARAAVQVVGFALSIGALGWAIRAALSPSNREQLARLLDATPIQILTMVALAAASVGVNGLIFWALIRPIKRLRATDVISVNAIATLLAYLPFKLSLIVRVAIHHKRDSIPVLTIGAWIGAVGLTMLAVLGPMTLVSLWRKDVDALWWGSMLVSVSLCALTAILVSRSLEGSRGIDRLARLPLVGRAAATDWYRRSHDGFEMVAHTPTSVLACALRMVDVALFAGRFVGAAWILGLPIGWSDALLLGSGYFLIGVFSPFGALGTREAGTIGIAAILGVSQAATNADSGAVPIEVAVVFITGVEAVVNIGCAGFGVAWLRADRMVRGIARDKAAR